MTNPQPAHAALPAQPSECAVPVRPPPLLGMRQQGTRARPMQPAYAAWRGHPASNPARTGAGATCARVAAAALGLTEHPSAGQDLRRRRGLHGRLHHPPEPLPHVGRHIRLPQRCAAAPLPVVGPRPCRQLLAGQRAQAALPRSRCCRRQTGRRRRVRRTSSQPGSHLCRAPAPCHRRPRRRAVCGPVHLGAGRRACHGRGPPPQASQDPRGLHLWRGRSRQEAQREAFGTSFVLRTHAAVRASSAAGRARCTCQVCVEGAAAGDGVSARWRRANRAACLAVPCVASSPSCRAQRPRSSAARTSSASRRATCCGSAPTTRSCCARPTQR